jgi:hypothetical protein
MGCGYKFSLVGKLGLGLALVQAWAQFKIRTQCLSVRKRQSRQGEIDNMVVFN